jgi:hypothetical protein
MKNVIAVNVNNATITAASENPDYLFSDALKDNRLSRVGRTLLDAAQWVKFVYTGAISVDTVCIFGNNFTKDATVKIEANTSDAWVTPAVSEAMTYSKNYRKSIELGRDVGVWSHQFSTTQEYQYWRLTVDDGSNPDTYIEIGFVFMDEDTVFPGMSVNQVFKNNTTANQEFSVSGQVYGLKNLQYNVVSFSFPTVTNTEKIALEEFFNEVDIINPYCMMVWESSLDVQRPIYVVNNRLPEWRRIENQAGLGWAFNLEIREVF